MAQHTPERWNVATVRDVLQEYAADALAILDEVSRKQGVDPSTATVGLLLDIGAQLAWVALLNEGQQPRAAEAALTHPGVNPRALSRRLLRSSTVTVSPPRLDP
jgi:hypothetical protein